MVCVSCTTLYAQSSALIDSASTSSVVAQGSKSYVRYGIAIASIRSTFDHVMASALLQARHVHHLHSSPCPPRLSPLVAPRPAADVTQIAPRPPVLASATIVRPLNTCQPTSRTTYNPLQVRVKTLFGTTYRRTRSLLHIGPFDPPSYVSLPLLRLELPLSLF